MSYALRESPFWEDSRREDCLDDCIDLSLIFGGELHTAKPSRQYSRRSSHIQQLRNHLRWSQENADDYLVTPSAAAAAACELFINKLPEGCLDLELAISSVGEINMFFPAGSRNPFQLFIADDGTLSYFGVFDGDEFADDDKPVEDFPFMQLLKQLGRK